MFLLAVNIIAFIHEYPRAPIKVLSGKLADDFAANSTLLTRTYGTSKRLNAKRDQAGCVYKRNKKALVHDASLAPGGENEVWDIEDLVNLGTELKGTLYRVSLLIPASDHT